jgi:peptide chain release factor 3
MPNAMNETPASEAARRRTFAIISHPDAGKTTLTEHLLLLGGAIHAAGRVKARGEARRAKSDWMKIEQERGISVTSAVMTFEYENAVFNLLDTPGHEDFSEDTYRTLTAADSAVMVIDAAKGIESQTRKLFEVCRLRDIPILTFVNKLDREARDSLELLDEISDQLQLECAPMVWPVGMGLNFRGTIDLYTDEFSPFGTNAPAGDNALAALLTGEEKSKLEEDVELARSGLPRFDHGAYREGHQTPVYFGSALKNFGVRNLLSFLAVNAPPPGPAPARGRTVEPSDGEVTGFVFKVQANMDPNHRDRVAFLRLASGRFRRGMKLVQSGTGKSIGIHNPILFFAQERETVDEAFPGDIIGIPNHGVLRVGDPLSELGTTQFRAGDPAPRAAFRSHETETSGARAGEPGRRGRDPGLQAGNRRALDRGRGRPLAARCAHIAPQRGVRPRRQPRTRAVRNRALAWRDGRRLGKIHGLQPRRHGDRPRRRARVSRQEQLGARLCR